MNPIAEETLVERLKTETQSLHTEVERSGLMAELIRGRIERPAYCALLRNLAKIYAVLEAALDAHANDPRLAPIHLPELARSTALAEDLHTLHGSEWAEIPVLPATIEYSRRLEMITDRSPHLLAAHAYVRYLGDLSGGQILRRIVAKALQLDDGEGTRFYEFPEPGAAVLKSRFRQGLAAIPLDREDIDALVDEAQLGFALHASLFKQLAGATALRAVP